MAASFLLESSTGSFANGDAVRIFKYVGEEPKRLNVVAKTNAATTQNTNFPNPELCPDDIVVVGCESSNVNVTQTNQSVFTSVRQDSGSPTRNVSAQPDLCFFASFDVESEIGGQSTAVQVVSVHFKKTVNS